MLVVDGVVMLDVREAARLASRTPETVRRWIWSGRLSAQRQGNRLLVARSDVENLLGGATSDATPQTLATWAQHVVEQRRSGALGRSTRKESAASLVLEDRAAREAG